ncbi:MULTISPECIES: hypothetical protein [unclassified Acidiphilium]|jgi:K+-transporting ATPase c subunit|uniref:hypothetical protein n=1 Tax=unclassified Acidiphilium TaxID=2617493 RepID=UPI00157B5D88|nr:MULTISPECIES: hypothetical protein [unclassified Acidiphilium]HQT62523.1 hypothetical protein [Acidiphilium sp.]
MSAELGRIDPIDVLFRRLREIQVVFRQNYSGQRAERNRLKQAKKEAKDQERRDAVFRRKAGLDSDIAPQTTGTPAPVDADATELSEDAVKQ